MKTLIAVLCLFCTLSFAARADVTVVLSTNQPSSQSIPEAAIVPFINLDISATETTNTSDRWHTIYLVVQLGGWAFENTQFGTPVQPILINEEALLPSFGPFENIGNQMFLVGPIYVTDGETVHPTIWGMMADDLSHFQSNSVSLNVVGIAMDSYSVVRDTFQVKFPLRGPYHTIVTNPPVGRLSVTPTFTKFAQGGVVTNNASGQILAEFTTVVTTEPVESIFPRFQIDLNDGIVTDITDVKIVDDTGKPILGPTNVLNNGEINPSPNGVVWYNQKCIFPVGTNHWFVVATVGTNIPNNGVLINVHIPREQIWSRGIVSGLLAPPLILDTIDTVVPYSQTSFVVGGTFHGFNSNLTFGSIGTDVLMLQRILNLSPDTQVAVTGPGSPGNEGYYFDEATKAAVVKFQIKNGIPGTGFVGPLTRSSLNNQLVSVVKIDSVSIQEIPDSNLNSVYMFGSIKPNTAYISQVSVNLKDWQSFGEVSKTPSVILKEYVGSIDRTTYKNRAFFRIVEKP